MALGSQEAEGKTVPGHNNGSSVTLTHSGRLAPRNAEFTQAQNAALLRPRSLIATVVFAQCPQASRAIKKVIRCDHGLPFMVGVWRLSRPISLSEETQMIRGGVLFPGRGPLPLAGRS